MADAKGHRMMVEEIAVTPFFRRHGSHMPATLKLHAEMRREKDGVVLESRLEGYTEEDVLVSATPNTIDVTLILERSDEGDARFHNSYVTPYPIREDKLKVEHEGGKLRVTAPKRQ